MFTTKVVSKNLLKNKRCAAISNVKKCCAYSDSLVDSSMTESRLLDTWLLMYP